MTKHVVVIGAGMGGLAAACELAASGLQVTLLERHSGPGGKMRQLSVGNTLIDSGPTVFTMRYIFEGLFSATDSKLEEHIDLLPVDKLARHSWTDGSQLDLHADLDRSCKAIKEFAGTKEAKAYRQFAKQSKSIFTTLDKSFMRSQKPNAVSLALSLGLGGVPKLYATKPFDTLWNELGSIFKDPRLQQLFGRYATYCGSSPFEAPATLMLIAHAERTGVWLVDGGMQKLAEALATLAQHKGANIHYDAHVDTIDVSAGHVTGVTLESGESIKADAVVFNGDTAALANGLLGRKAKRATKVTKDDSLSAMTWSTVAKPEGFELAHHTVLFGDDYEDEFDNLFKRKTISQKPTVYICAQDRGPGRTLDGPERLFFLINAPARDLSAQEIERYEGYMFDCLKHHGLNLKDVHADSQRTTPNEFAKLFPATNGALYGRPTHGWNGSFSRPGSTGKIDGLFFAGGSVHPGPGVPMATMSGRLAAQSVLNHLAD